MSSKMPGILKTPRTQAEGRASGTVYHEAPVHQPDKHTNGYSDFLFPKGLNGLHTNGFTNGSGVSFGAKLSDKANGLPINAYKREYQYGSLPRNKSKSEKPGTTCRDSSQEPQTTCKSQ